MSEFDAIFQDKSILVTGHTGFKGSWLTMWLSRLGARVVGLSVDIPTEPAMFSVCSMQNDIIDCRLDVRNREAIGDIVQKYRPDYVFHLAAQPLVHRSYTDPLGTIETNALGSANILDSLRCMDKRVTAVMITSDKAYDNVEWIWGYREMDKLGGKDPYSASKGMAELVIRSYVESFFNNNESNVRLAVGRAGNVIGGGDWAPYRVVPDCVKAWSKNEKAEIRNPHATRPWQHVLEPLSGYLSLAVALNQNAGLNGEAFNFGPSGHENHSVEELVQVFVRHWPGAEWVDKSTGSNVYHEASLLKLNCEKAFHVLQWKATLDFWETTRWTAEWYRAYYEKGPETAAELTSSQIDEYVSLAGERSSFKLG